MNSGNLNIIKPRNNTKYFNSLVILEANNVHILKNKIIPLFSKIESGFTVLQSNKLKDFQDWSLIVDIYYYGYHKIPEGVSLIKLIKSN